MRANILAIKWIGVLCALALLLSLTVIVANAFTVKDNQLFAGALTIAAIAGSGVGGLIGHLNHEPVQKPEKPIVS